MKRQYGKIFSVASIVAGLCATGAAFGDTMGVTKPGTGTKTTVNLQSDYNEDSGRYINSKNNPAMNPDFNLVSEVNKVDIDFMTTVIARYSIYDQSRRGNFDFLNQNALFGVHMFKSGWSADLLVRFAGNNLRTSNQDPYFPNTQPYGVRATRGRGIDTIGQVGIRKADIGYRFWHNKDHLLKFRIGRYAPFGATAYDDDNIVRAWGTDATVNLWGPTGSGDLHGIYVDGMGLFYQGKWGGHSRLNAEIGVASDLPVFLYLKDGTGAGAGAPNGLVNIHAVPYQAFGNDSSFGLLSTNTSRAWLADLAYIYTADWGDIQVAVDGGGKTRAENSFTPANGGLLVTDYTANSMYYVAGSIGYTMQDKMAVGVWYNWTHTGDTLTANNFADQDGAVSSYGNPRTTAAGNYSVFGIGINGTSKLWDYNNVGGKGGVLTWGAGYNRYANRNGFNAAGGRQADTGSDDINLYSLAFGYARGPATVELDWALFGAGNNIFYRGNNANSTVNQTAVVGNVANVVYLVGTFDI